MTEETLTEEVITIYQGRPKSPYFKILQPVPGAEIRKGSKIRCIHPRTQAVVNAVATGVYWTYVWDELEECERIDLLMHFGIEPIQIREGFLRVDPGFSDPFFRVYAVRETV
jgi:hypothetical protein